MRCPSKILLTWTTLIVAIMAFDSPVDGQVVRGQKAPVFDLADINGERYHLAKMENHPMLMLVLYFFDVTSRSNQKGLLILDDLAKRYENADLKVWAITRSAEDLVEEFVSQNSISYPFLLDTSKVSDLYQVRSVLPFICILGPRLQVLDYIKGGGKATERMLVKLAEKELQRKQVAVAKAISENVIRENPQNLEAKVVKGYAELEGGELDDSEKTFRKLAQNKGRGEVLGKEGLVSVYAAKGQAQKALKLAEEVEQKAPDRGQVHAVKAEILYIKGKKKQARAEYQKAVRKKPAALYQKAVALNKLGRLQASVGNLPQAREHYDQAVGINPYYIEAMANSGQTYEKEGKWDKALNSYRHALSVNKDDVFAAALAKRAESLISLQNNTQRRREMNKLVQRLAERFRKQQKSDFWKKKDTWTSRPLILTFVDMKEEGGLPEREGFASVLMLELTEHFNTSGRIQVVERMLMERLLEELDLGAGKLADPETKLRLGKILAAKIIATGALVFLPTSTMMHLRLIDTETAAVAKTIVRQFDRRTSLDSELTDIQSEIQKTLVQKYPLRGFVVQALQDRIMINLGSKQGVQRDTKFEVLKTQQPIKYKDKILHPPPKIVAQLQVDQVEADLSYARILEKQGPIARDDKVQEKQ